MSFPVPTWIFCTTEGMEHTEGKDWVHHEAHEGTKKGSFTGSEGRREDL